MNQMIAAVLLLFAMQHEHMHHQPAPPPKEPPAVQSAAPRTNSEIASVRPEKTLAPDEFDRKRP